MATRARTITSAQNYTVKKTSIYILFCLNKFAGAEPDETDSKLRDSTVHKHAVNLFHCHTLIPYTSAQREFIILAEIIL